jgi:hypothetical protein
MVPKHELRAGASRQTAYGNPAVRVWGELGLDKSGCDRSNKSHQFTF